jgi:L-lactate utilization protein LutB
MEKNFEKKKNNKARAEKIIRSLEKRNMKGFYYEDSKEAVQHICTLIKEGDLVGLGGSETIIETGLIDELRNLKIQLLDRYKEGITKADIDRMRTEGLLSDVFIASTNAITLDGKLVNQDGIGNRVACMIFGPEKVIIVTGMNKVVPTVDDAIKRIKSIAAPLDSIRVNVETPCHHTGVCNEPHCYPPNRICSQLVIIESSMAKDRIHVFLIGEELGY